MDRVTVTEELQKLSNLEELPKSTKSAITHSDDFDPKLYSVWHIWSVAPGTITEWRRASQLVDVMEDKAIRLVEFEHFQPTHAQKITTEFRRLKETPWSEDTKAKIIECVEHCEDEKLTAKHVFKAVPLSIRIDNLTWEHRKTYPASRRSSPGFFSSTCLSGIGIVRGGAATWPNFFASAR